LKVEVPGLKALPFANYDRVRQGQLVFAFGNPEGLRNSVSMGVISSAARQLDQDSPNVYVQTDAPINPGNSGGPLVNVDGEIVGMNTFIFTESGGSQGLGFAIPSAVIAAAYPQLRQFGHVHRAVVGLSAQAITPALAENLALPISTGVVIADVEPDSPAAAAGVAIGDILTSVNARPVDSIPRLTLALDTLHAGDTVTLGLVRGEQTLSKAIAVIEAPHPIDQLIDLGDPDKNAVPKLGVVGVNVEAVPAPLIEGLRIPTGVLVTARRQEAGVDSPLIMGDVIHAVNTVSVRSLDGLQVLMNGIKSNDDVVLQVERDHHLMFVTLTID
jgi:serine protease Do